MSTFRGFLVRGCGLITALAMTVYAASNVAGAAEWTAQAELEQTIRYDDNIRLSRPGSGTDFGSVTTPRLSLYKRTERLDLGADAEFSFARFAKDRGLNSEDANLDLSAVGREKWGSWALPVELERRTTQRTEITDTGRLDVDAVALTAESNPSVSFDLSATTNLSLLGNWRETRYNTSTLDDFRGAGLGARGTRRLSERDSVYVETDIRRFDNLDQDFSMHWLAAVAGYDRDLTERLSWGIHGGARWVFDNAPQASGREIGFTGGARLNYDVSETFRVTGDYERTLKPSGGGVLRDTDALSLLLRYQLRPTVRATFGARYIHQESLRTAASGDRDYFRLEPSIEWTVAPEWILNGAYRFRGQDREDAPGSGFAKGHTVLFSVTYRPVRWTL
jgi:hypothetical protein